MPPTPKSRENRYEHAMITPVHSIQQGTPTNAPANNIVYDSSRSRCDMKHEIGWNASVLAIPSLSTSSRCADEQDMQTSFDHGLLSLNGFENICEPPNIHPRHRSVHDVESRGSLLSQSAAAYRSLNGFYPATSEYKENFPFITHFAPPASHICLPKLHHIDATTSSRHNLDVRNNLKRRAPPSFEYYFD